ncbi:Bromodomain-containing protein [Wallemia mellicola]|nr:Bromodomain-containing protein [Wallemia mellicola]
MTTVKDEFKGEADDDYVDEPLPVDTKIDDHHISDDNLISENSRKRRRLGSDKLETSYQVNNLQQELEQARKLFDKIKDLKDESGRQVSLEFLELPNGEVLPDYYSIIKKTRQPISFKEIQDRLNNNEYVSLLEMKNDFDLCFANAKKYNAKQSQIVLDAKFMLKKVKESFQKFCESGSVDGDVENDSNLPSAFHPPVKSKRGRPKGINKIVKKVLDKLVIQRDKPNIRVLSEPFMVLPDEKEFPYYYDVIENPMSFDIINRNMAEKFYTTISEIVEDLELMFNNAMHFNEEGSEIHADAKELKYVLYELLKLHVPDDMLDEKLARIVLNQDGSRMESTYVEVKPPPKTKPPMVSSRISLGNSIMALDSSQFQSERSSMDNAQENIAHQLKGYSHMASPSPSGNMSTSESKQKQDDKEILEPRDPEPDSTHSNKMLKMQPSLKALKVHRSLIGFETFVDHALIIPSSPGAKIEVVSYNKEDSNIDTSKDILLRCNGTVIPYNSINPKVLQDGQQAWSIQLKRQNTVELFVTHRNSEDAIESTEMYKIFLQANC